MAKMPEFMREGWKVAGPGACRCPDCGAAISTNALARASHARACYRKRKAAREARNKVFNDWKLKQT